MTKHSFRRDPFLWIVVSLFLCLSLQIQSVLGIYEDEISEAIIHKSYVGLPLVSHLISDPAQISPALITYTDENILTAFSAASSAPSSTIKSTVTTTPSSTFLWRKVFPQEERIFVVLPYGSNVVTVHAKRILVPSHSSLISSGANSDPSEIYTIRIWSAFSGALIRERSFYATGGYTIPTNTNIASSQLYETCLTCSGVIISSPDLLAAGDVTLALLFPHSPQSSKERVDHAVVIVTTKKVNVPISDSSNSSTHSISFATNPGYSSASLVHITPSMMSVNSIKSGYMHIFILSLEPSVHSGLIAHPSFFASSSTENLLAVWVDLVSTVPKHPSTSSKALPLPPYIYTIRAGDPKIYMSHPENQSERERIFSAPTDAVFCSQGLAYPMQVSSFKPFIPSMSSSYGLSPSLKALQQSNLSSNPILRCFSFESFILVVDAMHFVTLFTNANEGSAPSLLWSNSEGIGGSKQAVEVVTTFHALYSSSNFPTSAPNTDEKLPQGLVSRFFTHLSPSHTSLGHLPYIITLTESTTVTGGTNALLHAVSSVDGSLVWAILLSTPFESSANAPWKLVSLQEQSGAILVTQTFSSSSSKGEKNEKTAVFTINAFTGAVLPPLTCSSSMETKVEKGIEGSISKVYVVLTDLKQMFLIPWSSSASGFIPSSERNLNPDAIASSQTRQHDAKKEKGTELHPSLVLLAFHQQQKEDQSMPLSLLTCVIRTVNQNSEFGWENAYTHTFSTYSSAVLGYKSMIESTLATHTLLEQAQVATRKNELPHFFYLHREDERGNGVYAAGYVVDGVISSLTALRLSTRKVYHRDFSPLQSVLAHSTLAGEEMPPLSMIRVVGDHKEWLYKNYDPYMVAIVLGKCGNNTANAPETQKGVRLVLLSTLNGQIYHDITLPEAGRAVPIQVMLFENVCVVVTYNTKSQQHELTVLESFIPESTAVTIGQKYQITNSDDTITFDLVQKTFTLPGSVTAFALSRTLHGISTRELYLALANYPTVITLTRGLIDARRPITPTPEDWVEGLIPYSQWLEPPRPSSLTLNFAVERIHTILAAPTERESTTLVAAIGLDIFIRRERPNGKFDSLSDEFGYSMLLLTCFAVAFAAAYLRKVGKKKQIEKEWK